MVIPNKLQYRVLEELHDGHLGVVKMKVLARSYVWWPNINGQLEELAKACGGCQQNQKMPAKANVLRSDVSRNIWNSRPSVCFPIVYFLELLNLQNQTNCVLCNPT